MMHSFLFISLFGPRFRQRSEIEGVKLKILIYLYFFIPPR